ncbi:MAG: hypothetical protein ACFFAM_04925 [Promethearchaeota archaeon]
MLIRFNLINILKPYMKSALLLLLVFTSVPSITSAYIPLESHEREVQGVSPSFPTNIPKMTLEDDNNLTDNSFFDIESLYTYVGSLYEEDGIFFEAVEGYATSIATYEALSILRFLGLDYYQFGSDWADEEVTIADNLLNSLRDESESGGFLISTDARSPSLEGTFGVTASLWIMNELPLKLKPITPELLNFVIQNTYDRDNGSFHEFDQKTLTIKATFQALTILDLIRKVVIIPELYDEEKTLLVNKTVLEFVGNFSDNIYEFLESSWENDSYFYSHSPYQTKIEDTWYALGSIKILEELGKIVGISLPIKLIDYKENVINWLISLKKTSGITKGGFGTSEFANISETGLTYAILQLFNATDEINNGHNETLSFVYSSQFLKRENRQYRASETVHLGGFGPNNRTYSNSEASKRVNIHDSYYATLVLLLSDDIFNSINLSLETSHYQEILSKYPESINQSNYIIQGKLGTLEQYFSIYNYKSHGSLELKTSVDNWNFTHPEYTERNTNFVGKSNALYIVNLENDTDANFNWTLGSHRLTNIISIRNLPIIQPQRYYHNSTLFVGYENKIEFDATAIKPGGIISTTIQYQNRSLLTYSTQNITDGTVTANLKSPNGQKLIWFNFEPINKTIEAINYVWDVPDQALLGTWKLTTIFNQSKLFMIFTVLIEVNDTVFFDDMSILPHYYPGEDMNLNISLKYSNGNFTPFANASLMFSSNKTNKIVFNLTLQHFQGTVYSTRGINCPTRFLYGFYNASVRLVWNSTLIESPDLIVNKSLPIISIKGVPTLSDPFFKTNYRSSKILVENNEIYYGETVNLSFSIGFRSDSTIYNVTDEKVFVRGGLTNLTQPSSFIQLFKVSQKNESLFLNGLINTNLPNTTFGTRFQILAEWNNTYVYIRKLMSTEQAAFDFSLVGSFMIEDITYVATEMSNGLHYYALDTTPVISISFKVINKELEENAIPVPNLNLYGILDIQDKIGTLNRSLPSITSAVDQTGNPIYLISIPTTDLSPNRYEIGVYTWTAIKNHLKIGQLLPGFRITRTFSPQPILQPYEVLVLFTGLIFIILVYLNLKKFR